MISNNKSVKVGANIKVNEACANVDYKYGLWNSKEEAFEALGENGDDVLAVGLTIGVLEEDGVHEYWFQKACNSIDDLVPKNGSASADGGWEVPEGSTAEETPEIDSPKEVQQFLSGMPNDKTLQEVLDENKAQVITDEEVDEIINEYFND